MAKMTTEIIEKLYKLGRRVYLGELSLKEATAQVGEIADSSAEFYIGLYGELIKGKGSTWNQNTELLIYYVDQISQEYDINISSNAYRGAMKFAKAKSRQQLIDELKKLDDKYHYKKNEIPEEDDYSGQEGEETTMVKDTLTQVKKYISLKGFSYKDDLVDNLYLSLKSKPFVILAGTSGTGKTKLVKLFAEAIGADADNGRYKLVSVRPDWSDSSDLFGHVNLQGKFVPRAIIDFIEQALKEKDKPFFLCLDEMNLARVEYYLSDFLSIIETRTWKDNEIKTDNIVLDHAAEALYPEIYIPENLYLIGTVNMDETTFPFSKKVLDRANTIEFSYVDLVPDFEEVQDAEACEVTNDFLKSEYIVLKKDVDVEDQNFVIKICSQLQSINEILQEANSHVGYRVRDEIVFYMLNNKKSGLLAENEAMDNEIMQKILPRIQGSGISVKELLIALFKNFAGDYSGISQDSVWRQMDKYIKDKECVYKKSAEKICYMMRRFEEDGFTSYWL